MNRNHPNLLRRAKEMGINQRGPNNYFFGKKGSAAPNWKGGVYENDNGYLAVTVYQRRPQLLHRLIMENHLGRKLKQTEVVHHINENRLDNRIENLQIMTRAEHTRLHVHERFKRRGKWGFE